MLAFPDWTVDLLSTALSGGSWSASLPLANLQNKLLKKVARSTDAAAASTKFTVDLGAARPIRAIALLQHNISRLGQVRVRGYSDAGLTILLRDTGTVNAWPAAFTDYDVAIYPHHWIFPIVETAARYWLVEITDTGNPAGYVELGRCWLASAFEPEVPIVYGAALGYESADEVDEGVGDVDWVIVRTPRRRAIITFPELSAEEKRAALIVQKVLGKHGELLFVMDSAQDASDMLLQSFPAKLLSASPLSYPRYNAIEMPLELKEIV